VRILYGKTKWEAPDLSLDAYFDRVKADGFDIAELFVPHLMDQGGEIRRGLQHHGLQFIAGMGTFGATPADHLRDLERFVEFAVECGAIRIMSQTSRDIFSFEDNCRIFERAVALSEATGIPIAIETHRSRPTYSAVETRRYLEAIPALDIGADFSHWMAVHESDLRDQMENVEAAIERTVHVHARVGFEESPQVNDPRAPEWAAHLENHLELWKRIHDAHVRRGAETMTITPEFGPYPYMPALPYTQQPLADCWEVNVFMKAKLQDVFAD